MLLPQFGNALVVELSKALPATEEATRSINYLNQSTLTEFVNRCKTLALIRLFSYNAPRLAERALSGADRRKRIDEAERR
jgi:hypothetical protein